MVLEKGCSLFCRYELKAVKSLNFDTLCIVSFRGAERLFFFTATEKECHTFELQTPNKKKEAESSICVNFGKTELAFFIFRSVSQKSL